MSNFLEVFTASGITTTAKLISKTNPNYRYNQLIVPIKTDILVYGLDSKIRYDIALILCPDRISAFDVKQVLYLLPNYSCDLSDASYRRSATCNSYVIRLFIGLYLYGKLVTIKLFDLRFH